MDFLRVLPNNSKMLTFNIVDIYKQDSYIITINRLIERRMVWIICHSYFNTCVAYYSQKLHSYFRHRMRDEGICILWGWIIAFAGGYQSVQYSIYFGFFFSYSCVYSQNMIFAKRIIIKRLLHPKGQRGMPVAYWQ